MMSVTLEREFAEEAMNLLEKTPAEKAALKALVEGAFRDPRVLYEGYVDDHRNTDNAWMETTVYLVYDQDGSTVGNFPLEGGDDAKDARWATVSSDLELYASHRDFLKIAAEHIGCTWCVHMVQSATRPGGRRCSFAFFEAARWSV